MAIDMQKHASLLKELSDAFGVSGHEGDVVGIFRRELSFCPEWHGDALGGGYAALEPESDKPAVLLVAHSDEVGFVVEQLTDNGFIKFVTVGGWNHLTLCGQQIVLRALDGTEIPGIIGAVAPHFLSGNGEFNERELFIDVGAGSREELESWGVYPGCFAIPAPNCRAMKNGRYLMGKAFDDRVGIYTIIETFKRLRNVSVPCRPLAGASVQEEVGCRGARTIANLAHPDMALIIEGPPADDTPGLKDPLKQGVLGGGPQPRAYDKTTIPSMPLLRLTIETAHECGIPCQLAVRRTGSTDASQIHVSDIGVPSLVISVPVRNAHSPVGVIDLQDVENTVALLVELLKRIDRPFVQKCRGGVL